MRWLAVGAAGRGWDGGASAARARTGSVTGPVAGLSRDLASGTIGDFAASLVAGISLAAFFVIFLGRCAPKPLRQPYTKKMCFFQ